MYIYLFILYVYLSYIFINLRNLLIIIINLVKACKYYNKLNYETYIYKLYQSDCRQDQNNLKVSSNFLLALKDKILVFIHKIL